MACAARRLASNQFIRDLIKRHAQGVAKIANRSKTSFSSPSPVHSVEQVPDRLHHGVWTVRVDRGVSGVFEHTVLTARNRFGRKTAPFSSRIQDPEI